MRPVCQGFEILKAVVVLDPVAVVDILVRFKETAKTRLNHQAVLGHVAFDIGVDVSLPCQAP